MRHRKMIMERGCESIYNPAGRDPQAVNMGIVVELLLDVRQIAAAQLILANGGSIVIPGWMKNIAEGK